MPETPAQRALSAATLALAVAVLCVAQFLPPWLDNTLRSLLRVVAAGVVLAVALLLHWVFVGMAAGRQRRSVAGWVALSALLFPVGSVAALVLLNWLDGEPAQLPQPAPHRG